MTEQDSNQKVSEQEQLIKTFTENQSAINNADIVEIERTESGDIALQIYGQKPEEQYRVIINGDFEVVGKSIITEEDKAAIRAIDEANEKAFEQAMKSDEEVLYDAIVSKVKSLWK